MRKSILIALAVVMCFAVYADAQPKKVALIGRISWCPGSDGSTTDRDFDIMYQYSMDDEMIDLLASQWGYLPILMPDYVVQYMTYGEEGGQCPFPSGDDADYTGYINDGVFLWWPTFLQDEGFQLAYVTGTCWSSIAPDLTNSPVPVMMGEHSTLAQKASKPGSIGMFSGEETHDQNGYDSILLTDEGMTHPLTAGLPEEIIIFGEGPSENPESAWAGLSAPVASAAPGTVVLAVWAHDANQAAIAVMEAGGKYADGTTAPARRIMPFFNGGEVRPNVAGDHPVTPPVWLSSYDHMTPAGKAVMLRSFQWAMGETPTPVDGFAKH